MCGVHRRSEGAATANVRCVPGGVGCRGGAFTGWIKTLTTRNWLTKLLMALAIFSVEVQAEQAATPSGPTAQAPAAVSPPPAATASDYVIGPGDTLQVFVWRNPDLTVTVPVRPDGKISTPLVEDMVAVGKTPTLLARDIEKALSVYVKSPEVNVIVTQPASAFSQVKVIGQVLHPQAIPYRNGMTVLDAVLAVGGLNQFAAGNRAHLVRNLSGKSIELKVKLGALVNDGDMSQNLRLEPGDVLVVPETRF
jgi:polysaccharide biosynthesis/export protein